MMLPFRYPTDAQGSDLGWQEVRRRIDAVLANAKALAVYVDDLRLDLPLFIQRRCWFYGVHPFWVLTCLEHEQGLLSAKLDSQGHLVKGDGNPITPWSYRAACGEVGTDEPGSSKPQYEGLLNQIDICARNGAWSAGIGPDSNFGYRQGLWPSGIQRWLGPHNKKTLDLPPVVYAVSSVFEHVVLEHCPHARALKNFDIIFNRDVLPAWNGG